VTTEPRTWNDLHDLPFDERREFRLANPEKYRALYVAEFGAEAAPASNPSPPKPKKGELVARKPEVFTLKGFHRPAPADALQAAVASFNPPTADIAERLRIWLKNNLTPEGQFLDKRAVDRIQQMAIEAESAAHPGKKGGKNFDADSYALAGIPWAAMPITELHEILGIGFVPIENEQQPGNVVHLTSRAAPKGEQRPAFPLVAWRDIGFDMEDEWRVDEVFPLIGLACLYGGPSTVKTFVLLDLLARMARGGFWGGREVKQSPVVYIAAEGSGGIKKRISGIKKMHAEKGLSPDIPFFLITVAPNLGTGVEDLGKLIKSIEALGIVPGGIAVDTTSRAIGGADENGPGMDQLVNNGTALANYFSCLVVLVHHTPLADDERLRGRTTLIGGLDVSMLSKREKGSLVATLCIKKMRDEDDEQSFTVTLARIILGHTKKGREVSTLVVETVEPGAAEGAKQDKRKAIDILRDEFIAAYDRLADFAPKSLGLDNRSSVLKVKVDAVRDELKNRGFLETKETGGITDTARSQFQRVKTELAKTKGGKFAEDKGLIWRL
jgi:AAA domain